MRKKSILLFGAKAFNYGLCLIFACVISNTILPVDNMCCVYAQNQDVQYEYDSTGRITIVRYPDGTEIQYQYDINGNILSSEKISGQTSSDEEKHPEDGKTSEEQPAGPIGDKRPGDNQTNDKPTENGQANGQQPGNGQASEQQSGSGQTEAGQDTDNPQNNDSSENIKKYNQFKNSKPIIKSLKSSNKKKIYYLKISIKQVNKYGENGYQIKYSTNKKFKKSKTLKIAKAKKGSITNKQWKIKRGKTYYVKVRAFMRTETGEIIYSKYSKVKKIRVKK